MKLSTTLLSLTSLAALASAHDAPHLNKRDTNRLLQARSLCSRSVHCILTSEATEGPYYIPEPLVRSNITEDRIGVPLTLRINVVDVTACEPAGNVWVDIWHADAGGEYSGWASGDALTSLDDGVFKRSTGVEVGGMDEHGPPGGGPPGGGGPPMGGDPQDESRWLRGVAQADEAGLAVFETVMPAWYFGRTTHIHIRIHTGSTTTHDGMLVGAGRVAHTGQLFFADSLVLELAEKVEPYKTHARGLKPQLNEDDGIYIHSDGSEQLVSVEKADGAWIGEVTVGVDPSADHQEDEGMPGGHGRWAKVLVGVVVVGVVLAGAFFVVRRYRGRRAQGYIVLPMTNEEGADGAAREETSGQQQYRDAE